ncbi:hypothetical protein LXA43DRAFT_75682 [Ganoderma leucocontextum]|nr:hypothetical protein LXA43DRAFT_75682 [Ganoderma leucocontextum]
MDFTFSETGSGHSNGYLPRIKCTAFRVLQIRHNASHIHKPEQVSQMGHAYALNVICVACCSLSSANPFSNAFCNEKCPQYHDGTGLQCMHSRTHKKPSRPLVATAKLHPTELHARIQVAQPLPHLVALSHILRAVAFQRDIHQGPLDCLRTREQLVKCVDDRADDRGVGIDLAFCLVLAFFVGILDLDFDLDLSLGITLVHVHVFVLVSIPILVLLPVLIRLYLRVRRHLCASARPRPPARLFLHDGVGHPEHRHPRPALAHDQHVKCGEPRRRDEDALVLDVARGHLRIELHDATGEREPRSEAKRRALVVGNAADASGARLAEEVDDERLVERRRDGGDADDLGGGAELV